MTSFIIAIDGVSSSGKGTLARKLAELYGIKWLDTGKLYRMVAYEALQLGVTHDAEELSRLAAGMSIDSLVKYDHKLLNNENVGTMASVVSKIYSVRQALLDLQRDFAYGSENGAILDGRDIGTVICPGAHCKIFVTASIEVRAIRRHRELQESGHIEQSLAAITSMLHERDLMDAQREFSPMIMAHDAYCIDTSNKDVEAMVRCAAEYIDSKSGSLACRLQQSS